MLSTEIRERIVAGYERVGNAQIIADSFQVSLREVYRLLELKRKTGSVATQTYKCGRKPSLTEEDLVNIRKAIQEQPDITLNGLIEKLNLPCSESVMSRTVRKMGFRLKKKVIHASEQERPRCGCQTRSVERVYIED